MTSVFNLGSEGLTHAVPVFFVAVLPLIVRFPVVPTVGPVRLKLAELSSVSRIAGVVLPAGARNMRYTSPPAFSCMIHDDFAPPSWLSVVLPAAIAQFCVNWLKSRFPRASHRLFAVRFPPTIVAGCPETAGRTSDPSLKTDTKFVAVPPAG